MGKSQKAATAVFSLAAAFFANQSVAKIPTTGMFTPLETHNSGEYSLSSNSGYGCINASTDTLWVQPFNSSFHASVKCMPKSWSPGKELWKNTFSASMPIGAIQDAGAKYAQEIADQKKREREARAKKTPQSAGKSQEGATAAATSDAKYDLSVEGPSEKKSEGKNSTEKDSTPPLLSAFGDTDSAPAASSPDEWAKIESKISPTSGKPEAAQTKPSPPGKLADEGDDDLAPLGQNLLNLPQEKIDELENLRAARVQQQVAEDDAHQNAENARKNAEGNDLSAQQSIEAEAERQKSEKADQQAIASAAGAKPTGNPEKNSGDKNNNAAAGSDSSCPESAKVKGLNGAYRCSVTRGVVGSAQAVSQAATLAGSVSTQIAGGVAVGAAKSGSMAATYNAAGDAALGAAWSNWGVAAINTAMGGILSDRARGHAAGKSKATEEITKAEDAATAARKTFETASPETKADAWQKVQEADAYAISTRKAFSEQEEHEGLANASSMGAYTTAATSIAQGIQQYQTAQANYRAGCVKGVGDTCNETPFGNPNYDGSSPTEQSIVPDVVSNSDGASTDDITGIPSPDSAGDPNNPTGGGGGPILGNIPTGGGGGGGAPGGGGGGLGGGGSTSAAKDESGEGAPSQAHAGKQPFYASGSSSGYAGGSKGSSGGSGKGGVGDLASMLAAAFGKKPGDEKDKTGSILDFDKNRAAENASLLSKETNFFARIHEAYQEKQRTNAIGFVQAPARALASDPARKGARK